MTRAKSKRLSYGTMVLTRAMIVQVVAADTLAQAVTIAVRYSCVRRQSELKPGYISHQYSTCCTHTLSFAYICKV